MTASSPLAYEFGPFRLDVERRVLVRRGDELTLSPKAFDMLALLVEQAGTTVTKDTLLERVWFGAAVEENSVAKTISELRRGLRDEARAPRFVATVARHGYRFVAPVHRMQRPRQRRIAVLPFTRFGAADGDEYLGVGLADALITRLGRGRDVIIRPTRAILPFAAGVHDAVTAGHQLDVDSVLDGTIRRGGDRVRLTAQLVDVSSGAIAWAETFDQPVREILSLEDILADRVIAALALVITGTTRAPLIARHTPSAEAHEWDLQGRFHLARRTAEDCRRAITAFERALDADSQDAVAYAGIAEAYVVLGIQALVMGGLAPAQTFPRAKQAIEHALRLDPYIANAHTSQGQVRYLYDWEPEAAEQSHRHALDLEPNAASTHHAYGMILSFAARHDEALAAIQRARELDPLSPTINTNLGRVLYSARRYDEAIERLEWTVRHAPESVVAHHRLGIALEAVRRFDEAIGEFETAKRLSKDAPTPTASLAHACVIAGRHAEGRRILRSLLTRSTDEYVAAPCVAEVYLALGEQDRAFEWFDRAVDERSNMLVTLQSSHRYDAVRQDRRFQRLVDRVGLWRA
jgi:DNA-binding winged helix-turn-helix (wHTH) protein/Tfp pilus assembly protein PilF